MSLADHERTETVLEFAMRRMGEKFRPIHIRNEKLFLAKAGDVFRPCFFSGRFVALPAAYAQTVEEAEKARKRGICFTWRTIPPWRS